MKQAASPLQLAAGVGFTAGRISGGYATFPVSSEVLPLPSPCWPVGRKSVGEQLGVLVENLDSGA